MAAIRIPVLVILGLTCAWAHRVHTSCNAATHPSSWNESPRSVVFRDSLKLRGGGGLVKELATKADFDSLLKSSGDKLIVVDFTATWCGPCQRIAPVLEKLAGAHQNIIFVKVDVDANEETSSFCGVQCMPTFQFYKQGKLLESFEGADEKKLTDIVTRLA